MESSTFYRDASVTSCVSNWHFLAMVGALFQISLDYSTICDKRPLSKRPKIGLYDELSLNAGIKHCRMLQVGH